MEYDVVVEALWSGHRHSSRQQAGHRAEKFCGAGKGLNLALHILSCHHNPAVFTELFPNWKVLVPPFEPASPVTDDAMVLSG
jgi:hypothetical protein